MDPKIDFGFTFWAIQGIKDSDFRTHAIMLPSMTESAKFGLSKRHIEGDPEAGPGTYRLSNPVTQRGTISAPQWTVCDPRTLEGQSQDLDPRGFPIH